MSAKHRLVGTLALVGSMMLMEPVAAQQSISQAVMPGQNAIQVGVAAAVKGNVKITTQSNSVGREIESGKPIYLGDIVKTDEDSRLQIMLMDETVFTIGPSSAIVIDEFVYDPATDDGKVHAEVIKGIFRFVTGRIAHKDPANMDVKLPSGNIGVRGTIVTGQVIGDQSLIALRGPGPRNKVGANIGRIEVSNPVTGGADVFRVMVSQPGDGTTIPGAGLPPTPPAPIPANVLKAMDNQLAPTQVKREERRASKPAPNTSQAEPESKDGEKPEAQETNAPRPGARQPMGPEGEHKEGPPTIQELRQALAAGEITEAEFNEMVDDVKAWHAGDAQTRAELDAKYSDSEYDPAMRGPEGDYDPANAEYRPARTYDRRMGPEGPGMEGPPTPEQLHMMLNNGEITEGEFDMMMTDLQAWQAGDAETRAELDAKYSDYDPANDPYYDPARGPYYDPANDPYYDPDYDPANDPYYDPARDPYYDPANDPYYDPNYDPANDPYYDPNTAGGFVYDPMYDPNYDPANDPYYDPYANYDPFTDTYYDPATDAAQDTADQANQVLDGLTYKQQLEDLANVETGVFHYSGSAPFWQTIKDGSPVSLEGTMDAHVQIDFGARTIGGGSSHVSVDTYSNGVGGNILGMMSIGERGFQSSPGPDAIYGQSNGYMDAVIEIENEFGVVGAEAKVHVDYDDGSDCGYGDIKDMPRHPGP